jgi:nucleoside-diphosphate-sugar epimerase
LTNEELHVVFGASGNTGSTIIRELVAQGKHVRGVSRSGTADVPPGVEMVSADALNLSSAKTAAEGAAVIYHCMAVLYSEWTTKLPTMMTNIIEAATAQGSNTKVVYVDNLYMYGKESALKGPLTENTPHLATGKKGKIRSAIANQLMAAHKAGRLRATIGRASDFYGPRGTSSVLDIFVFPKVLAGKKAKMFGDIEKQHSYMYLEDFAKGIATLASNEKAYGEVWHIPHGKTLTTREFIELVFEEAGVDSTGKIGSNPKILLVIGGLFNKLAREVKEVIYQAEVDWVVDHSKFEKSFSFSPTPNREAIKKTLEWYRDNPR